MSSIKIPETKYPILEIIKNRWSARSFSDKKISDETLATLIEAASWAASSNNEQPWHFWSAHNGSDSFSNIHNSLMPGNQPWTKNAATFLICFAKPNYVSNNMPNRCAQHDLGMANAHILLQALAMDIYCHPIAGFDADKLKQVFEIPSDLDPICIIALGYLDVPEKLEEPFLTRENSPRSRKNIEEIHKAL